MATQAQDDELTDRELEVIKLVAAGLRNEGIAGTLHIAPATVKGHLESVYQKYHVHNRTAAVMEWLKRRTGAE